MPDTIRTFIAVEIEEKTRLALAKLQDKLKQSGADIKWVEPQNLHLTLKFLGDTPTAKINDIKTLINTIAGQINAFEVSLSEIGAFPNLNSPRVVWIGVKNGADQMKKIADTLVNEKFSAHLTLGRVRSQKNKQELKKIIDDINKCRDRSRPVPTTIIDHITLFQSTLTPKGPVYKSLYEAILKPA